MVRTSIVFVSASLLVACSSASDAPSVDDAASSADTASSDVDSSTHDAAVATDAAPDSGSAPDSGVVEDANDANDASTKVTYATSFDLTEAPISEKGAWVHLGLDWTTIDTANGIAFGTQTGSGGYDDSYAHLTGFPADQSAQAVIHRDATIDPGCTHEVEIHLRWSDAAHDAHGYECNLAYDGSYAQIVRWNGKLGDFTYLANGSVPGGVKDGDVISATAIGNQITLSVNGKVAAQATDATWPTGQPGMGFWRGAAGCGKQGDYGFTSYSATSL